MHIFERERDYIFKCQMSHWNTIWILSCLKLTQSQPDGTILSVMLCGVATEMATLCNQAFQTIRP